MFLCYFIYIDRNRHMHSRPYIRWFTIIVDLLTTFQFACALSTMKPLKSTLGTPLFIEVVGNIEREWCAEYAKTLDTMCKEIK